MFADTGQEVIECGRDLVKFHVAEYVKPVAGELACNNSHAITGKNMCDSVTEIPYLAGRC